VLKESIIPLTLTRLREIAGLGLSDAEIATVLDIAESTLSEYKKKHPEFSESIKKGKLVADQPLAA